MRDPGEVRDLPPPDPRPPQGDRRPRPGQHHDLQGRARRPPAPSWLKEGLSTRRPHPHPSLPAAPEGRLRRGGEDVSRLRRPAEQDPRQPPRRVPDALLRLAEHAQPPVLRRDLQQDEPRRPLPDDRLLGLPPLHPRRPEPAPRARRRPRRRRAVPQVPAVPVVREHDRELPVPLRDRPASAGSSPASSRATGRRRTSRSRTTRGPSRT